MHASSTWRRPSRQPRTPGRKGINYRMHPRQRPLPAAAGIDCCVLANNHVLDWGLAGLVETLDDAEAGGHRHRRCGPHARAAAATRRPGVSGGGRAPGLRPTPCTSSGIPPDWAARPRRPGVNRAGRPVAGQPVGRGPDRALAAPGRHRVVVSIHWGGTGATRSRRAARLRPPPGGRGGVDIVHGHSSHHPRASRSTAGARPLRLRRLPQRLRGDRRIRGVPEPACASRTSRPSTPRRAPRRARARPLRARRFRLQRATRADAEWLQRTLDREGRTLGTRVELTADGALSVLWS